LELRLPKTINKTIASDVVKKGFQRESRKIEYYKQLLTSFKERKDRPYSVERINPKLEKKTSMLKPKATVCSSQPRMNTALKQKVMSAPMKKVIDKVSANKEDIKTAIEKPNLATLAKIVMVNY
jgi:hypothetical protein